MLIICFFIGIAIVTPRIARKKTHANVSGSESAWPLSMMNAANAEMSVPPVDIPAELAVDCIQLFSRIVIGVLAKPIFTKVVQMA